MIDFGIESLDLATNNGNTIELYYKAYQVIDLAGGATTSTVRVTTKKTPTIPKESEKDPPLFETFFVTKPRR
jgi:hypothetical protein